MLFPWHSKVMLDKPWMMQLLILSLALTGSIVTWIRQGRNKQK